MKTKINEISIHKNTIASKSDLYTRYKKVFDKLLPLNDVRFGTEADNKFYIADEELDNELQNIRDTSIDTLSVLIGYAGIGKSTSLRHFFDFRNSAPVLDAERKSIVFPATFNGWVTSEGKEGVVSVEQIRNELTLRINTVNTLLEKKHPVLKSYFYSDDGQMAFYNFLDKTNPKVLEYLSFTERKNLSEREQIEKSIEYAFEKEPFVYTVSKLKFYLSQKDSYCNKIIVILDDIEPLPYNMQLEIILQYARFYECMRNTINNTENRYVINMIIALRPHTYSFLVSNKSLKAYFVTSRIYKRNMVNLGKLFEEKVEYYKAELPHENEEGWQAAAKVLSILNRKFNCRYANMIKNIALWNTRDAIEIYRTILENRIWIQRNLEKASSFSLQEDNFVFNNITVLRAISCEHRYVYGQQKSVWIPNILYNTPQKEYGFLNLCMIRFFNYNIEIDYTYGSKSYSYREIINIFTSIFKDHTEIEKDISDTLQFLYRNNIIQKSINDIVKSNFEDNEMDRLNSTSLLYLSPKGQELWNMLGADSVYLELCREDYFFENCKENMESSFELMQRGQQDLIFMDLLDFLLIILAEELSYIQYAIKYGNLSMYKAFLGEDSICNHLYLGIMRSVEFSGQMYNEQICNKKSIVEEKISGIRKMLA